jgi:PAS domain S-box-containing protein
LVGGRGLVEEQLQAALEWLPDAVLIVDDRGAIVLVNRQTEMLFGCERSELLGQPVELLVPARFAMAHREHRTAYMAELHVRLMGVGLELAGRRKDGSEFPVHISLGPFELDGRQLVIATVRDVSERLRAIEAANELAALRRRRREALELNDTVVQQLAAARLALDLGRHGDVARLTERALGNAQAIVSQLLSERQGGQSDRLRPGDLVRTGEAAANDRHR